MIVRAFIIGLSLFLCAPSLFALPKYSLKEKKRCYECHYNRKGGGPLNAKGKFFSQHRSLQGYSVRKKQRVAKKKPPAKRKQVSKKQSTSKETIAKKKPPIKEKAETTVVVVEAPTPKRRTFEREEKALFERTTLGANILLALIANENKSGPNDFFLMKAEPTITTRVSSDFLTVFGYNFAAPVLTAYGQYHSGGLYAQMGSFHLPFGIDTYDHNNVISTLIKEQYDVTLDTREVGVELGYEQDWFFRTAVVNGARNPRVRPTLLPAFDRNLSYVANAGYKGIAFTVPFLFGGSFMYERRIPPGLVTRGTPPAPTATKIRNTWVANFYWELAYNNFSVLSEFAYGRETPFAGDKSFGIYVRPAINITDNWSVAARAEVFARNRHFIGDSVWRYVASSEYYFSKYASIEPMIRFNEEKGNVAHVSDNEAMILFHVKF